MERSTAAERPTVARRRDGILYTVAAAAVIFAAFKWNPLEYVIEAGPVAYYQARLAFVRGDSHAKIELRNALADGKLTMHKYSKVVFPAFVQTVHGGEALFPDEEASKGLDQLRAEARAAILHAH